MRDMERFVVEVVVQLLLKMKGLSQDMILVPLVVHGHMQRN